MCLVCALGLPPPTTRFTVGHCGKEGQQPGNITRFTVRLSLGLWPPNVAVSVRKMRMSTFRRCRKVGSSDFLLVCKGVWESSLSSGVFLRTVPTVIPVSRLCAERQRCTSVTNNVRTSITLGIYPRRRTFCSGWSRMSPRCAHCSDNKAGLRITTTMRNMTATIGFYRGFTLSLPDRWFFLSGHPEGSARKEHKEGHTFRTQRCTKGSHPGYFSFLSHTDGHPLLGTAAPLTGTVRRRYGGPREASWPIYAGVVCPPGCTG